MTPTIRIGGDLLSFDTPKVMGIINVTPDSFFSGSRTPQLDAIEKRVAAMVEEGVDIIDIGGCSTRPGAPEISAEQEWSRLVHGLESIKRIAPEIPLSVDTFRSYVARKAVEDFGVAIINDISGGTLDSGMWATVADLDVAYVLMHTRGTPAEMQQLTDYRDVRAEVLRDLAFKTAQLRQMGVSDVIIDPGFGFAKTVEQNFEILSRLDIFKEIDAPLLAGLSRKTMIWKTLNSDPEHSLNGTTVLNTIALNKGADILRVHDVAEARECVSLIEMLRKASRIHTR